VDTVRESVSTILDRSMNQPRAVPSVDHIVERLAKRFGSGGNPRVRSMLYRRLATLCQTAGEEVYEEVCSVASAATSASKPDRYFCAAITRRLREMGYLGGNREEI